MPPAYPSLKWVALSYNPGLYGTLPVNFTSAKLYGWGAYGNAYQPASAILATASNGAAPTYGSGVLYGTGIGLRRTLVSVLRDVQAALDPTGVGLRTWGVTDQQPCPPWASANANAGQNATTPGRGRAWLGVNCAEWGGTTPATSTLLGGATSLVLKRLGLAGTLPATICALFPSLTFLDVGQNALRGSLPSCLGEGVAGRMQLSVFDNLFEGTVPASYAALDWVALSYNPYLFGALPANLPIGSLYAWSAYQNKCVPQAPCA